MSMPWRDEHGGPLVPTPSVLRVPDSILRDDTSIWRYRAAIPVGDDAIVSLGEGWTPLVPGPNGLMMKCDFVMPSGSFKDRGASVLVSGLRDTGIGEFFLDSSGNAGAAMAMYAAAAGLVCEVLVPESTPAGKTDQVEAHGARITRVAGEREEVARVARARAAGEIYASHNWQPLFLHGTKTLAFELWEQCGGRAPDHIVLPVGYGSSLLGCRMGFDELAAGGDESIAPRLHAAQAAACAPMHLAHQAGADDVAPVRAGPTVASAIAASAPIRGRAMLAAVRATRGTTVAVGEDEISSGRRELGRAGFHVEPSSAVAYAAALQLIDLGVIGPDETTVVVLTGTGLKT